MRSFLKLGQVVNRAATVLSLFELWPLPIFQPYKNKYYQDKSINPVYSKNHTKYGNTAEFLSVKQRYIQQALVSDDLKITVTVNNT
jgi:hypothetical protein